MRLVGWAPPQGPDPGLARAARVRRRAVLGRWRRPVAAVLVALAAACALVALRPAGGAQVEVLVAAGDLAAGATVGPSDLTAAALPAAAVPPSALSPDQQDRVVGAVLTAPVGRGETVTTARVLGPGLLDGAPPGTLAVPVEVSTTLPAGAVGAGDAVAVIVGADDDGLLPGPAGVTGAPAPVGPAGAVGPTGTAGAGGSAGAAGAGAGAAAGGTPTGGTSLLVERCVVLMPPRAAEGGLVSTGTAPVAVLALTAAQAQAVADAGRDGPLLLGVLPR